MIRIIKEGKPMSQTRHRHTSKGGFVRTYDPMAKDKEDFVKYVSENYDIEKIEGMIDVMIIANFAIPKSYSEKRKKALDGQMRPKKPDVDNIAKFYLDALNETLYDDDAQIVSLNVIKRYSILPSVIITFDEVMF
jgi:Holliday junction resolvase RusA-like endonuclease